MSPAFTIFAKTLTVVGTMSEIPWEHLHLQLFGQHLISSEELHPYRQVTTVVFHSQFLVCLSEKFRLF